MFASNTLWDKIVQRTEQARAAGALFSVATDAQVVEENGISFVVRVEKNLQRKLRYGQGQPFGTGGSAGNPFLPYDENMFVADLSPTHVCLLNKFNVVDHHILIVTREFQDQDALLTEADFRALWTCMAAFEGLGFYNGGKEAGASQQHKHLQMVPLPFAREVPHIPIESALQAAKREHGVYSSPALPFQHAILNLPQEWFSAPGKLAAQTRHAYRQLLQAAGLSEVDGESSGPYNLLVTRNWLLLVPRSRESFRSISINALGFAGSFFVRNERQLQVIKRYGPLTVLKNVALETNS